MNSIIRFWNQNRKRIIIGIIAIVFLIAVIQIFEQIAKQQNKLEANNIEHLTEEEKKLPTESSIGAGKVSLSTTKKNVATIDEFVNKCNTGDITGAYNMLTDYCKETLYPEEELFRTGYYNTIFGTKRIVETKLFMNNNNRFTYLVKMYEDALAMGKVENVQNYQDYITIDYNSKNGKLNIMSLIYTNSINKEAEASGIKVRILSQEIYKDYEKYQIKVENNTDKRILINTGTLPRSIYLLGDNNVRYNSNIVEISSALQEIPAHMYMEYELRFEKIYSTGVESKAIVFTDIVPDFKKYTEVPEEASERVPIKVNI